MSYSGHIWLNPSEDLDCFKMCSACFRCEDKGTKAKCQRCSGRHDPELKRDPHDFEDRCRCSEGILQYRTQDGKMIKTKYPHNPYEGKVVGMDRGKSEDEKKWETYLQEQRERRDDPTWDPITIDGESATDRFNDE